LSGFRCYTVFIDKLRKQAGEKEGHREGGKKKKIKLLRREKRTFFEHKGRNK
jgi:hypothetical protein